MGQKRWLIIKKTRHKLSKKITSAQLIVKTVNFSAKDNSDVNGYALVLTNKLKSIRSDGQKEIDII